MQNTVSAKCRAPCILPEAAKMAPRPVFYSLKLYAPASAVNTHEFHYYLTGNISVNIEKMCFFNRRVNEINFKSEISTNTNS